MKLPAKIRVRFKRPRFHNHGPMSKHLRSDVGFRTINEAHGALHDVEDLNQAVSALGPDAFSLNLPLIREALQQARHRIESASVHYAQRKQRPRRAVLRA